MRPVEQTITCISFSMRADATARAIRFAFVEPRSPVQAFALPLLAMITRTSALRRRAIETHTGAALTWFVVNVAAATAGVCEQISAMSGLFLFVALIPQNALAATKPSGAVTPPRISEKDVGI